MSGASCSLFQSRPVTLAARGGVSSQAVANDPAPPQIGATGPPGSGTVNGLSGVERLPGVVGGGLFLPGPTGAGLLKGQAGDYAALAQVSEDALKKQERGQKQGSGRSHGFPTDGCPIFGGTPPGLYRNSDGILCPGSVFWVQPPTDQSSRKVPIGRIFNDRERGGLRY